MCINVYVRICAGAWQHASLPRPDVEFLSECRNIVLIGGTGTGKTHLAVSLVRSWIGGGARGRFFNILDLVNQLEQELRDGKSGRLADQLSPRPDSWCSTSWAIFRLSKATHSFCFI